MFDFIHSLAIPTTITTLEGEVVDVNKSCLDYCKATSKAQFLNYCINEFLVDRSMHNAVVDTLLSGRNIQDQKTLLKFFDNSVNVVSSNVSLLGPEKKMIIIQNQLLNTNHYFFVEKFEILLRELLKLNPYMNKAGQMELTRIYNKNMNLISDAQYTAGIEFLTRNLIHIFPKLSSAELYICALICIGLSTKEMLHLTGYTSNNLRVIVHRICQKLNVNSREELSNLLNIHRG